MLALAAIAGLTINHRHERMRELSEQGTDVRRAPASPALLPDRETPLIAVPDIAVAEPSVARQPGSLKAAASPPASTIGDNAQTGTRVGGHVWIPPNLFATSALGARVEPHTGLPDAPLRRTAALTAPGSGGIPQLSADVWLSLDRQAAAASDGAESFEDPTSAVATGVISTRDLRGLYLAFGVLQVFDIHSTRVALAAGAREANPLMTGVVEHLPAFVAVKAASTAAMIALVETIRQRNAVAAIVTMAAINGAYVVIVANNRRVAEILGGASGPPVAGGGSYGAAATAAHAARLR